MKLCRHRLIGTPLTVRGSSIEIAAKNAEAAGPRRDDRGRSSSISRHRIARLQRRGSPADGSLVEQSYGKRATFVPRTRASNAAVLASAKPADIRPPHTLLPSTTSSRSAAAPPALPSSRPARPLSPGDMAAARDRGQQSCPCHDRFALVRLHRVIIRSRNSLPLRQGTSSSLWRQRNLAASESSFVQSPVQGCGRCGYWPARIALTSSSVRSPTSPLPKVART